MENTNLMIVDPGGDSDNDNFVVIDVSDEEFNSAIDSSCEDNSVDVVLSKNNLNISTQKEENSSDEQEDDSDTSEESGIHSEGINLIVSEEPIQFSREDDENENLETEGILDSNCVDNGNKTEKAEKDGDSSSDSSVGGEDSLSEPEEQAEEGSDSNEDSDQYETSSSDDDSDEITSDSDSDDSDDVSSDSEDSGSETPSDDSDEAVVSDSDNSDDSSEFSGGEGESENGSPKHMEEDSDAEVSPREDVEVEDNLSEEGNNSPDSNDEDMQTVSSPEGVSSPEKSDRGESSPESEKSPGGENTEENLDTMNSNLNETEESILSPPDSEGRESFPNSPRSDDEKVSSPGSPDSGKSYQSVLSDEAGSPDSNKSSDNSGNESSRSAQSEGSPKSGSSSGSGSPDSKHSQDMQESLSLPSSPHSGSESGSNYSGSPKSCNSGSLSPPESINSPRTPGSDEMKSPNSSDDAKSPESRSNSEEESTLRDSDENSCSPGSSSPGSNEPMSPNSGSEGSKSPSEGSGSPCSPLSVGSPLQSDGSNSPSSFGSPEEYSLSPMSPASNLGSPESPYSPNSPLETSPEDLKEGNDADCENQFDIEECPTDIVEMADEVGDLVWKIENEDLVEADDEDSQGSDDSGSSGQWTDIESESGEDSSEIDTESEESDEKDSADEFSSDSWDSYEDSCDSEDYEAPLIELEGPKKLMDISRSDDCISGSLKVGNFEEEAKVLLADDDSDNWEDVETSSEEESSENAESDNEDLENQSSQKLHLGTENSLNAEDDDGEDEENDWEIIDDNNNITEEENNASDDESSSSSSGSESDPAEEEEEKFTNYADLGLFNEDEDELMKSHTAENSFGQEDILDTEKLLEMMDAIKDDISCSVEGFSKLKMKEYLKTTGFIDDNLDETSEKTMDAKDLDQLITQQDNNLNSVSLGPDYEPEEIKTEISRFWGFYHSCKKTDSTLGNELVPLLVPMLIYFYVELISSALPQFAIQLFTLFGDKFIKEGGDPEFIKELMTLSEIKDQAEFEKNENLQSFQDRKYTFTLSVAAFDRITKFLSRSRTPVLISLFSDRFVIKLKFPDVQEVKVEDFENDVDDDIENQNHCSENGEENSDSEDLSSCDLEKEDIETASRAREVINKIRSNTLMDMPGVTVYTSNGRPVCGALSTHGTMVAYGMDPAGIRLCKTGKAQHFSDEDKENENQNQSSVISLNAHEGTVYDVAFHPKTKLLFSVGYDGFMRAWDLHKDKPTNRCVYSGHLGGIWTMDIAPSGRMIATGGMDTTARLWLPERNDYARLFVGHYFDVDCVKFHPNESYLATGSIDKSVRLWSINDGNMVRILTGCPGRVNALAFHESGKYIAGGGEDNVIRIWDIAEGELLYELPSEKCCKDLSFYGNKLAGCFDKSIVQIWDLKKLVGGDEINIKEEESDVDKFYNIFGDAKSSSDEENETVDGDIVIPAPYSIGCTTENLFKVHFRDSLNVFCLGAERRPVVQRQNGARHEKSPEVNSSANSSRNRVVTPPSPEDISPFSPPTLHEFPFLDSDHRATIESLEDASEAVNTLDYSGGYSTEAPNAMSTEDIDTSEKDKIRTEVETYDKLIKSARQDDDTWLTDL